MVAVEVFVGALTPHQGAHDYSMLRAIRWIS
jgi:hypothetical protein